MMDRLKNTLAPSADQMQSVLDVVAEKSGWRQISGPLFRKYVALFLAVVCVALLSNGLFEIWFSYREHKTSLIRIQREQAEAAAAKIGQFIREIESQVGWTTQLPWSAGTIDQRRFDGLRLLRQVPAITELAQLDSTGREQLKVSRLAMDVVASQGDFSAEPKFAEAVAKKVYYGPVYFRRESEPYMTLALAGTRRDAGVSVAEVNLKLIWDVITAIKVGEKGQAFVIDAQGRLIAHPDISLVLRNTDMTKLTQVIAARAVGSGPDTDPVQQATDVRGHDVLTAYASVSPLGWIIFVELPAEEAYAPLYDAIKRSGLLLLAGLILAFLSGLFLARRMVVPIQMLRAGAARIGAGDLTQRIHIKTGDELEGLANQFNDMTEKLEESYAGLEQKVEDRTRELSESLQQQTATSEVLRVISSSPGELNPVFSTMLENATRICEAKFGTLHLYEDGAFRIVAMHNAPAAFAELRQREAVIHPGPNNALSRMVATKQAIHIVDFAEEPAYRERDSAAVALVELADARSLVVVPMLKERELIGSISIYRQEVRPFTDKQIGLVTSFASQAVIAIENVRLLTELRARTDELAQSVGELRALGEVSQAVNSTLDVETVLNTIVTKAVQLSGTDAGAIYVHDDDNNVFNLRSTYGMSEDLIARIREHHVDFGETVANATAQREPTQIADLRNATMSPVQEIILNAGYRALLVLPLVGAEGVVGALVVRRKEPGEFPKQTTDLLQTFAAQSVLAIQNAHLFSEIGEKSRQLEVASQHKSQFLANMSHELRTPLNAILGYTELIIDQIYGETPDKMRGVLERVQSNGKHLLGLINDVLDLSKIEAGQLVLSLADYSIKDVVNSVFSVVESLANAKKLALKVEAPSDLPFGRGDERRLTQVVLNLVGNAIKFTDTGEVKITASAADGVYKVAVRDTGPGIDPADQKKIFEEFQQADSSATKKKGGTGLGLSISQRIVEMHGGKIWVESAVGEGSTFFVTVPLRVEQQVAA
jgi:signal transduction histidine kinase